MRRDKNPLMGLMIIFPVFVCVNVPTRTAAASTITVPNDHMIVPGVRMGPFVLGMTETQLLAMGRPIARYANFLTDMSLHSNIPVTIYCYQDVCVEVNQTNHLVQAMYTGDANGNCSYRTSSGATCGYTYGQLAQSFDLGVPDPNQTQFNPFNHQMYVEGFENQDAGTVTRFWFATGGTMASTIYTYVRGISMTYKNYLGEGH